VLKKTFIIIIIIINFKNHCAA